MKKPLFLIGTLAYSIMAVMAYLLFKERIAFLDASFILFSILSEDGLAVQVYRFGSAITQAVPLLASRMDFSLEAVMKMYSVCFPVYFYLLFLTCLFVLKKEKYAILLLLFNIGMVTHTFYWVIPEFQQGLALFVVYFAFLEKSGEESWIRKHWFWLINIALLATLAFFHPLMICPFAFFIAYFFFFSNNNKTGLLSSALIFLGCFLLKALVFKTSYDSGAMGGLKNFTRLFPDYLSIPANINFLGYLIKDYYLLILGIIAISVHFVRNKQLKRLGLTLLAFFGYLFLINVSYPDGPHQFYIESLYLPLSLILFLPLVFAVFEKIDKRILYIGLFLTVCIRTTHIYQVHDFYTERLEYITNFLNATEKNDHKKLMLSKEQVNLDKVLLSWAFSYECWLLSTLDTGNTRSIVTRDKPEKLKWALKKNKAFIASWGIYKYETLPERYFIFRDTSKYILLPKELTPKEF